MKVSMIMPGRNNCRYAKWSYDSIRKNQSYHTVEICFADDASEDGTWEWASELMKTDPLFKAIRNDTGKRVGHTILYDRLVNYVASSEICMIWHCDMYLCPGALDAIEKYMFKRKLLEVSLMRLTGQIEPQFVLEPQYKKIVSLTRIEPPLHPQGYEKIILDCGTEPEEFEEARLLSALKNIDIYRHGYEPLTDYPKTTEGIFAPWAFFKKDFQEIGGHDPLYRPQSREDTDIFNRFQLNGVKFIQTWEGLVYHMTCRGNRRNVVDGASNIYEDNPEWVAHNKKSERNFIRKWGHFPRHDEYMKPIIPHKYLIGLFIEGCTPQLLHDLEPWFTKIFTLLPKYERDEYIRKEQPNTAFNLEERIAESSYILSSNPATYWEGIDISVTIDSRKMTNDDWNYLFNISDILTDSGVEGETMQIGNIQVVIRKLEPQEHKLIINENTA